MFLNSMITLAKTNQSQRGGSKGTSDNLDVATGISEAKHGLIELSPSPLECDATSRQTVSELS